MKQLIINSRDGGLSDSNIIGTANSFAYAKNIDYQRQPGSIRLNAKNINLFTTDGVINAAAGLFYFTDNGKIYDQSGLLRYTMSVYPSRIYNAINFSGYYYWISNNNLHRISIGDSAVSGTWSNVTENYKNLGNAGGYPMLNLYNKLLYIGVDNVLKRLDINGNLTAGITFESTIVGLSFIGDYIRVYIRTSNGTKTYLVKPLDDEAYGLMDLPNIFTRSILNCGSNDYLLTGTPYNKLSTALYTLSGYSTSMLKRAVKRNNLFQFIGNISTNETRVMAQYRDMMFFGSREGIYTIGSCYPGANETTNFDYAIANDNMGMLLCDLETLYISYASNNICYFDKIDLGESPSTFMSSGQVCSRIYYGESMSSIKSIRQINLAFEKLNPGESIQVYIRKNGNTDWGNPLCSVDYTDSNDNGVNSQKFIGESVDIGDWNYIEVKIVLNAGISGSTSPTFYEFEMLYDTK